MPASSMLSMKQQRPMGSRVPLFSPVRRGRRSKVAGHREGFLSVRPQCAYGAVTIPKKDAPSIVPAYGRNAGVEFIDENGGGPGAGCESGRRKRARSRGSRLNGAGCSVAQATDLVAGFTTIVYMTTIVISGWFHAQDLIEGCQSELIGGGGSGDPREAVRHHPARQARGGDFWLYRLAAVIPRTFLRSAFDVGPT